MSLSKKGVAGSLVSEERHILWFFSSQTFHFKVSCHEMPWSTEEAKRRAS